MTNIFQGWLDPDFPIIALELENAWFIETSRFISPVHISDRDQLF